MAREVAVMKCQNCGAENEEGKKFCGDCGSALVLSSLHVQSQEVASTRMILVIIAIVIVVLFALVAALYVMVLGLEGESIETPYVSYNKAHLLGGEMITILGISSANVDWDEVFVQLTDGNELIEWMPKTNDLDRGSQITASYGAKLLDTLSVTLTVTDASGDGLVGESDYFLMIADPLFSSVEIYSAALIFKATGERMGTAVTFTGVVPITPAATYSKASISGGVQVNIVSITRTDVAWDQIKVQLSDGTNFWEWSTATDDLDGGSALTHDYGVQTTGGISVYLNVTDVGGNGFMSGSDYFRVTASPAFATGTSYTAVLIYTETSEKIGTGIAFTG